MIDYYIVSDGNAHPVYNANAELHARREPDQRYYGRHGTYTTCKCWNCRGGSPEAVALREVKQRTREAEQAAYARTSTGGS